jgi:polysaccharide biosynthesis/export protein
LKINKLVLILYAVLISVSILNSEFSLSGSEEILYNVSLSGAVNNPGVFAVPPSTRVSRVLKISGIKYHNALRDKKEILTPEEDLQQLQKKFEQYYPDEINIDEQVIDGSIRNIILKRAEEEIAVDLLRFYLLGDDANNPYIMDGDIILVPYKNGSVSISGAVNIEGDLELTDGDRISDIIELSLGTKSEAWLDEVEIVRFTDNKQTEKINVNYNKIKVDHDSDDNILLQLDDRIFVRTKPDFHNKTAVTVSGEVQFPGIYTIEEGKTTLLEIMQLCGDPTAKADLYNSFVQRREGIEELDPEFERLKTMSVSNMNKLEYAYYKNSTRELKGKYSTDIAALLNDHVEATNLYLQDGDLVIIPQRSSFINVTGQVVEPGLVAFSEDKPYSYYIEQAGGYDWNAKKSKVRLIKANTGKWTKPEADTVIMEGDIIFVPEKPEFDAWQFTLDSLRVISQIATLIIVVQNLSQ